MNPSSMEPLQGANSANAVNATRDAMQNAKPSATGDSSKESRTQKLERTKAQIASGSYSPDLQSLANKLVQGGYLRS